jgi:predicted SPOUT superfamily RNA methylase MTH1
VPVINTIPGQGTATVRLEEAIIATLAIRNVCKEFNTNP